MKISWITTKANQKFKELHDRIKSVEFQVELSTQIVIDFRFSLSPSSPLQFDINFEVITFSTTLHMHTEPYSDSHEYI